MALTKITGQVINDTTGLVVGVTTVGGGVSAVDGFFSGIVTAMGNVTVGGTLTYEDVTNIDAVGLVTARNGIVVGSGITLSKDGDIFTTGIITATSFVGSGANLTGVASTENIRTNTNATFLQNVTVVGTSTVTGNIVPSSDSATDIGTNSVRFQNAYVDTYYGSGANLTSLPAAQLTGTLPAISGANLTGIAVGVATTVATGITGITTVLDLSNNDHKITVSGITTVDVRGGTEGHSHSLRIINSGITTVGFSTYFLFPSGASPIIPTADGTISMISFTVHRQGVVGLATQLLAGASVNFS